MDIQHIKLTPKIKAIGTEESRTLRFVGSTETPDRAEDIISVAGWYVKNYMKNPIVLWAHRNDIPPIAKAKSVYIDERSKSLVFDIDFPKVEDISDPANPSEHALFVDTIYRMCKAGLLNAVSVGFRGLEAGPREDQNGPMYARGNKFKRQELLELSVVPVPANPDALVMARSINGMTVKGIELVETFIKSAIPFKSWPLADEDTAWDGPKIVAESDTDALKIMCAWYDSSDPKVKSSYKLPHHMGKDDGYKTVWAGVKAAMGALLGARGGVDIPEAEHEDVYRHLAKHYEEFKKEAPEMKTIGDDMEVKELNEKLQALETKIAEITTAKSNRRLSKASMVRVEACQGHMAKAMDELKALVSDGVLVDDDDTSDGVEKPRKESEIPEAKAIDLTASVDEMNEYLRNIANTSKE